MLRLIGVFIQATMLCLIAYNSITSLWGLPDRSPAPTGPRQRRVRVVVPAHNEQSVIGAIVADIQASTYPRELFQLWVVADRSDDNTAVVAEAAGARVARRTSGNPGKGDALSWYLTENPLAADEVLVLFDADNRVPPEALGRMVDEIDNGHDVVQCYLDVTNPDSSLLTEAAALSYWAGNRMVQLARSNLGWTADLGGTGMAITGAALDTAGGFRDSLTEDQDLGVRLLLCGTRVEWVHDVRVQDEKPRSAPVAIRQRARWMSGKRAARRAHLSSLLRSSEPGSFDMAIRLIQPGRSFIALLTGLLTVAAFATDWNWLLPWPVLAAATALQFLLPIPFLLKDGIPLRRIVRYPLLTLVAALWIPVRLVSTRRTAWYHTSHEGVTRNGESNVSP